MKNLKVLFTVLCVACATTAWGEVPTGWTEVTSLSQLSDNDYILIVTNDGNKYLNGSVSSGHFSTTAFSATSPKSTSASGVVQLVAVSENTFKLKLVSTSKYITATKASSGSGSVTATSDNYGWTFSKGNQYFDMQYQNSNAKAYARSYSNTTFRTYGNKSGAEIRLFKYSSGSGETTNYTVQWMVGGAKYTEGDPTTEVASGSKVTTLPTAPADNRLSCAEKFMGWSTTNIGATPQSDAPEILFTTAENSPNITENTTFYAVFATKQTN